MGPLACGLPFCVVTKLTNLVELMLLLCRARKTDGYLEIYYTCSKKVFKFIFTDKNMKKTSSMSNKSSEEANLGFTN